tara:strand:+ start:109 stop:378 length:270 start_codon:yes stop_codon:yes gene_type:complete
MMESPNVKSMIIGAIAAAFLFACADANNINPIIPEANAANQTGQDNEIGRYVFHESSPTYILDSVSGTVYYGAQFDEGPWKKHHWFESE